MKLSEKGELSLVTILEKRFKKRKRGLILGIGDDSAVVKPGRKPLLLTTDMMVEGVHFDLRWTTPYQLGYKIIAVNVSDIYAMGGRPDYVTLNFAASGDFDMDMFRRFLDGLEDALERYGAVLIGGDISSSDKMILSATVTGSAAKVLRRSGAKVGDRVYVTGCVGDSAAGLALLKRLRSPVEIEKKKKAVFGLAWDIVSPLIRRHLMPEAVSPGRFINKATAMMDISDGLFIDLLRLCRASRTGVRLYSEKIPVSEQLRMAAEYLGLDPLELAVGGGEDYELLFTAPAAEKIDAFCVGEITRSGMHYIDAAGKARQITVKGYQHFAL
ncbi:MAG: thiamine-phosphate kinase [Nitrospirae bacterium]|nr:thiamine-phosphate kinase [Nitrospirota bacterium]